MVPDHQVRRKWSGDASKKVQLFKVGGSRIIGTAVSKWLFYIAPNGLSIPSVGSNTSINIRPCNDPVIEI